jgi:predicted dehydrogenase
MTCRRVALLGFGRVAEHGHLPAWRARDDVRIVAVADPDPARRAAAARLLPHARVGADAATLLAAERSVLVDIAAPPAVHVPLVEMAARAGCHVLCEKPLATRRAAFARAAAAARGVGVALGAVHNWKHAAQFQRAAGLLAEGALGRLAGARVHVERCAPAPGAWRTRRALAEGGVLVDHGWHVFYLLASLAGDRPLRIRATTEWRGDFGVEVEDTASCRIEFATWTAELFLTWAGRARRTGWELRGDRGWIRIDDDGVVLNRGANRYEFESAAPLSASSHHPEWFGAVIDEFLGGVDDPTRRDVLLAEAERCATLTELAYASAAQDGVWMECAMVSDSDGAR